MLDASTNNFLLYPKKLHTSPINRQKEEQLEKRTCKYMTMLEEHVYQGMQNWDSFAVSQTIVCSTYGIWHFGFSQHA